MLTVRVSVCYCFPHRVHISSADRGWSCACCLGWPLLGRGQGLIQPMGDRMGAECVVTRSSREADVYEFEVLYTLYNTYGYKIFFEIVYSSSCNHMTCWPKLSKTLLMLHVRGGTKLFCYLEPPSRIARYRVGPGSWSRSTVVCN